MAVDDEGRCYYYHIRTQQTQWTPPTLEDCQIVAVESSESSDSLDDDIDVSSDDVKELIVPVSKSIPTLRTRFHDRAERRKKTGLVQERIISVCQYILIGIRGLDVQVTLIICPFTA